MRYKPKGDHLQIVLQCEDQAPGSAFAFPIFSQHGYSSSPPQLQLHHPVKTEILNNVKKQSKVIIKTARKTEFEEKISPLTKKYKPILI